MVLSLLSYMETVAVSFHSSPSVASYCPPIETEVCDINRGAIDRSNKVGLPRRRDIDFTPPKTPFFGMKVCIRVLFKSGMDWRLSLKGGVRGV
ncbi:hypothetical protein JTE90_000205 [Oedothorax gibbosus]|uniref:Secreted protein n=1 Tax=Oedothorax gibbosus TaxID=931172 RepID=A0AAV6VC57_9ARAC|nr:hypothetical protein JTE90_000205 [Oedothorax gibbosus]